MQAYKYFYLILIVNYNYSGIPKEQNPLYSDIQEVIEDYPLKATLWKNKTSGADVILDYLKIKNLSPSKITVSGVNICICVYDTVADLSQENNFLIELDEPCCACNGCLNEDVCKKNQIAELEKCRNVIGNKPINNSFKSALERKKIAEIEKFLSYYAEKMSENS